MNWAFEPKPGPFAGARPPRSAMARYAGGIVVACCLLARPAAAEHGLQIQLDTGLQSVRDDVLAPIASSGPRFGLGTRYFGELGPGLLTADVGVAFAYVLDRMGAQGATTTWALHASYLPVVQRGSWTLALGPALGWDNETFLLIDWDDAHAYWIGTSWLGPGVRAWRRLSPGWRMDIGGELGLLGWQSRTPDGRRRKQETSNDVVATLIEPPTKHPRFGWLADWQLARASVELYHGSARGPAPSGWGLAALLGLTRAVDPAPAFSLSATLRFSYTWSL